MPFWKRQEIRIDGGRDLTIKVSAAFTPFFAGSRMSDERVEVVSKRNPLLGPELPVPPVRVQNPMPFNTFVISPDEEVIIAGRKVASGTNETFVFHRVHGLRYGLADTVSLHKRIGHRFAQPEDVTPLFKKSDSVEYVLFQGWLPGGRNAVLACSYNYRDSVIVYCVTCNTLTGRLSDYHRVPVNAITTK